MKIAGMNPSIFFSKYETRAGGRQSRDPASSRTICFAPVLRAVAEARMAGLARHFSSNQDFRASCRIVIFPLRPRRCLAAQETRLPPLEHHAHDQPRSLLRDIELERRVMRFHDALDDR